MRCALIASLAAAAYVSAVRLDEEVLVPKSPAEVAPVEEAAEEDEETLKATEKKIEAHARHGAAQIKAHRHADTSQALDAATKHLIAAEHLSHQVKSDALKKAGRHAIRLDKVVEEQRECSDNTLKAEHLAKGNEVRAKAATDYAVEAQKHHRYMESMRKLKEENADLRLETAVRAAREVEAVTKAWDKADSRAEEADAARKEAIEKHKADVETAEEAVVTAEDAEQDRHHKMLQAKALAFRADASNQQLAKAQKHLEDASEAAKNAGQNFHAATELSETSSAEADKATADALDGEAAVKQTACAEDAAQKRSGFEASVAHSTLEDAVAATQVHAEKVTEANKAAAKATKVGLEARFSHAAERAAHASLEAARAEKKVRDVIPVFAEGQTSSQPFEGQTS